MHPATRIRILGVPTPTVVVGRAVGVTVIITTVARNEMAARSSGRPASAARFGKCYTRVGVMVAAGTVPGVTMAVVISLRSFSQGRRLGAVTCGTHLAVGSAVSNSVSLVRRTVAAAVLGHGGNWLTSFAAAQLIKY